MVVSKKDDDQVIFKGFRYNNLYLVDFTSEDANLKTCLFTKTTLGWLWHRRLAHVGMSSLKNLMKNDLVRGLKDVKFEKDKLCSAYQAGKQVANTHPTKAFMSTTRVLELLHMDLFGPTTYKSLGGQCLMSTTPPKLYGRKLSTPHAMHPTAYSFKSSLARHLMSCSMERSRTSPSLGCLVVNATSTRSGNT